MATVNTGSLLMASTFGVISDSSSNSLEAQLCKYLAQSQDASSVSQLVGRGYQNLDFCGNRCDFGNNLMVNNLEINTPNFIIESEFAAQAANLFQDISFNLGELTYTSPSVNVLKNITLDPSSRSIFQSNLDITIQQNRGPFLDKNGSNKWNSVFSDGSKNTISMAINSGYNNNIDQKSLLSNIEDCHFNTNYAIAGAGNNNTQFGEYFTIDVSSNGSSRILVRDIPTNNTLTTAVINIPLNTEIITSNDFGIYKIIDTPSVIDISLTSVDTNNNKISISPNDVKLSIGPGPIYTNLPNTLSLNVLKDTLLSGQTDSTAFPGEWFVEAVVNPNNNNDSGYFLNIENNADNYDSTFMTLDNGAIVDNSIYMETHAIPSYTNILEITQNDMSLISDIGDVDLNGIGFTTTGEKLSSLNYDNNGNIELSRQSDVTQRVTNKTGNTEIFTASVKYEDETTDYGYLRDTCKTTEEVDYEVENLFVSTVPSNIVDVTSPDYQVLNSAEQNATAYIATADDIVSKIQYSFTPNDATHWVELYNIEAVNYIQSDYRLYINSNTEISNNTIVPYGSTVVDGIRVRTSLINIDSTEHINKEELRLLLVSKQLEDLEITKAANSQLWNITIDGDFVKTETPDLDYSFPSLDKLFDIIDNPGTLSNINITYANKDLSLIKSVLSSSYLSDSVIFKYLDVSLNEIKLKIRQNEIEYELVGEQPELIDEEVTDLLDGEIKDNPINDPVDGNQTGYTVWKKTNTKIYTATFKTPLAAISNLYFKTPVVKSILTEYYLKNSTTNEENRSTSLLNGLYLRNDAAKKKLQPSEIITNNATGDSVFLNFSINNKTVTALHGLIQGKSGAETTWTSITNRIDVDPHFGAITNGYLLNYNPNNTKITLDFDKNDESGLPQVAPLVLDKYSYQNEIVTSNESIYTVAGKFYDSLNINGIGENSQYTPAFNVTPNAHPNGMSNISASITSRIAEIGDPDALENKRTRILTCNKVGGNAANIFTVKSNSVLTIPNMVITYVSKNVFRIEGSEINTTYIQNDNSKIRVDDGVQVEYSNSIEMHDIISFTLGNDSFRSNMVGAISAHTVPSTISNTGLLEDTIYTIGPQYSEGFTLQYYRGHLLGSTNRKSYTLERLSSIPRVEWVIRTSNGDAFDRAPLGNMYLNNNPDVIFNNVVTTIGKLVNMEYSRLPSDFIVEGTHNIEIDVIQDTITFTSTNPSYNISAKSLGDYPLFDFKNGDKMGAKRIISDKISWRVGFKKNGYGISKAQGNAFQDPASESIIWNSINSDVSVETSNGAGYNFGSSASATTLPFTLKTTNNTISGFVAYYVVAPPQILFTQANTASVRQIPFNSIDCDNVITRTVDAKITQIATYTPFLGVSKLDNVTFTQTNAKSYSSYINLSDPITYTYEITGSNISITENENNIYDGKIIDLLTSNIPAILDVSSGIYTVSYSQNTSNIGINNPYYNISFTIGNQTLPSKSGSLGLDVSGGTIVNIIGVKSYIINDSSSNFNANNNNYGLQLYKYVCPAVKFPYLSNSNSINNFTSIKFTPTKFQYANVSVPDISFGLIPYSLQGQLSKITTANIQGSNDASINWITDTSFVINNPFNFGFTALDLSGQNLALKILNVNKSSPNKFTYITTPDIISVCSADGSSLFRVDANGRVTAQTVSSSLLKLFTSTAFESNKPINGSNNEFISYNTSTFN